MLSGNKYTSRSGSAIYQCLQQIPKEDYFSNRYQKKTIYHLSAFRDRVKRLQKMCFSKGGIL